MRISLMLYSTSAALPSTELAASQATSLRGLQGKISKISRYDPLDLFSSDPFRVQQALLALFREPQNNLRMFLGGKAVQLHTETGPIAAAAAAVGAAFGAQHAAMAPQEAVQALAATLQSILAREG